MCHLNVLLKNWELGTVQVNKGGGGGGVHFMRSDVKQNGIRNVLFRNPYAKN